MTNNNQNSQPNYAEYREFSNIQGDTTECSSENEENYILSNDEYKIRKIPSRLKNKNDKSDDNLIPRMLYDEKSKKFCYQLDYNTFILLIGLHYQHRKKLFEIDENRVLFLKNLRSHKLYGRGELTNESNYDFEEYENIEEYNKKYGELDKNGEFKKPSNKVQEIKIYKNLDDYFKRKCYLYENMDKFEKNDYTIYYDIYDYYLPNYIKKKIKRYEKLLPSDYEEKLDLIRENINTYKKRYNILYNEDIDLIKLNDKDDKLVSLKDIKEEDIKDHKKSGEFLEKYFFCWIKHDEKNEKKFEYGTIYGTIDFLADEIEYLTQITKNLYYIKEDINLLLEHNTLDKSNKYKNDDIKKLKQIKEKAEKLWPVFYKPLFKIHKILINYIKLYEKIITHPIFFKLDDSSLDCLGNLSSYILDSISTKFVPSENNHLESQRESRENYTLCFPNYKKNEYLRDLVLDRIESQHDIFKNFYHENDKIKENLNYISSYFKKYKEIFRPENKLNLKEDINEKSDIKDKKMLNLFMCYAYDIINYLNSFKKDIKNLKSNTLFPEYSKIAQKEIKKRLSDYILEKNEKNNITKESENIILKDLEKVLNLYIDLFLKDKDIMPKVENLDKFIEIKKYLKDFNKTINNNPHMSLYPIIQEQLFKFLKLTKKYIGKDKKESYESLYNLCKTLLKEKVKKPEKIFTRYLHECVNYRSSSEDSVSETEIITNPEQKIEQFQKIIKKYKEYIKNSFKNFDEYYKDKYSFYYVLKRICENILPDIKKYKEFIEEFKNYEKINSFENEVKSLEKPLFDNIKNIIITAEDLYEKEFKDKSINKMLNLYKAEDSYTIMVKQMVEKLNNIKNEEKIKEIVKLFKNEINENKEYIENIYKYENKQEFLDKLKHLCDNIIATIKRYNEFIETYKNFNEEIKEFENDVELFKTLIIENLENIIKEIKNQFKEENSIVEKLKEILENLNGIKNYEEKENLNKIVEEKKEQNKTIELGSKKFKEDLKEKEKEIENKTNKNKNKELSFKEFKEDLKEKEKSNKELKNELKNSKEEFNKIDESSQNKINNNVKNTSTFNFKKIEDTPKNKNKENN